MGAAKRLLTFSTAAVAPLLAAAKATTEHRASYDDLFNPAYHKGGQVKKDGRGWPMASNLDATKIPAALWLVKDHGAYLMANISLPKGKEKADVVYAKECDPTTLDFDTWWNNTKTIVGGDDCVITLPVTMFEQAIASGSETFQIQLLQREIRVLQSK